MGNKHRGGETIGYHSLRAVGWQVRALGHLIAHYRTEDVTMTEQEIYGLGTLLGELGERITVLSECIEAAELQHARKRRQSTKVEG